MIATGTSVFPVSDAVKGIFVLLASNWRSIMPVFFAENQLAEKIILENPSCVVLICHPYPLICRIVGVVEASEMSLFTRSIQDRCFAAFLSLVLMTPTGLGLKMYFTLDHSKDNPDWMLKVFLHICMEAVSFAFLLSVFGLVWAVLTPTWMERALCFALDHIVLALAALLCVIPGMFGVVWFTLYHTRG